MASNTTRLSVEISKTEHKKLKILADMNDMTLREFVLSILDPILHPKKNPNQTTLDAIENTEKGIGIKTYENLDQMWENIGLN